MADAQAEPQTDAVSDAGDAEPEPKMDAESDAEPQMDAESDAGDAQPETPLEEPGPTAITEPGAEVEPNAEPEAAAATDPEAGVEPEAEATPAEAEATPVEADTNATPPEPEPEPDAAGESEAQRKAKIAAADTPEAVTAPVAEAAPAPAGEPEPEPAPEPDRARARAARRSAEDLVEGAKAQLREWLDTKKQQLNGKTMEGTFDVFDDADTDKTGHLSASAFGVALRELHSGISGTQLQLLIDACEKDTENKIDYLDFVASVWGEIEAQNTSKTNKKQSPASGAGAPEQDADPNPLARPEPSKATGVLGLLSDVMQSKRGAADAARAAAEKELLAWSNASGNASAPDAPAAVDHASLSLQIVQLLTKNRSQLKGLWESVHTAKDRSISPEEVGEILSKGLRHQEFGLETIAHLFKAMGATVDGVGIPFAKFMKQLQQLATPDGAKRLRNEQQQNKKPAKVSARQGGGSKANSKRVDGKQRQMDRETGWEKLSDKEIATLLISMGIEGSLQSCNGDKKNMVKILKEHVASAEKKAAKLQASRRSAADGIATEKKGQKQNTPKRKQTPAHAVADYIRLRQHEVSAAIASMPTMAEAMGDSPSMGQAQGTRVRSLSKFDLGCSDEGSRAALWKKLDRNNNGKLSLGELSTGMRKLFPLMEDLHYRSRGSKEGKASKHEEHEGESMSGAGRLLSRAHKAADFNNDGLVSRHEFAVLLDYIEYFGRLWEQFEQLDKDSDRTVSQAEFIAGFTALEAEAAAGMSKNQLVVLFRELDLDGNESVTFDEFCRWMAKRHIDRKPKAPKMTKQQKSAPTPAVVENPAETDAAAAVRRPKPPRGTKRAGGRTAAPVAAAGAGAGAGAGTEAAPAPAPAAPAPAPPAAAPAAPRRAGRKQPPKPETKSPADDLAAAQPPKAPAAIAPSPRRGRQKQQPQKQKPKKSAERLAAEAAAEAAEKAAAAYALRAPVRRFAGERSSAAAAATKANAPSFGLTREERRAQKASESSAPTRPKRKSKGQQEKGRRGKQQSNGGQKVAAEAESGTQLPHIGQHAQSAREALPPPGARNRAGKKGAQTARGAPQKQQAVPVAPLGYAAQPLQWAPQYPPYPPQQGWPQQPHVPFVAVPAGGGQYY